MTSALPSDYFDPGLTSALPSDYFDPALTFADRRVRSLSHASYPSSPIDSPASPFIPATPVNTPVGVLSSPTKTAPSPPITTPPTNTPVSKPDSGFASPTSGGTAVEINPPDFLKAHHFQSPLLHPAVPTVPPNSPESWPVTEENMSGSPEEVHASLGERLAAFHSARPQKYGFTNGEMKFLKEHVPKAPENHFYEIRALPGKGYGCFAIRPIRCGTRILADDPLLIVPNADYLKEDVQDAFDKLSPDDQVLYFTLHSAHGQDPNNWPKHIHNSVEGRERCRIEEQHSARTAKEPSLISIFQTNCMEKEGGAAVFPHAARFNHSCNPNACFAWNPAIQKETIHTMRDVKEGEQITLAYCDMTHNKATRKWELKHYGFSCDCPACSSDDSDPVSFASKSASRRYRLIELDQEFRRKRGPYLEFGCREEGFVERLLEYAKLLKEEGDHTVRLANTYLDMALICERNKDLKFAKVCAQNALKVKLDCQGPDAPDTKNYVEAVQRIKKKMEEQRGTEDC